MSDEHLPITYGTGVLCVYCDELRPDCDISTDEDGDPICQRCLDFQEVAEEWGPCDVY